MSELDCCVSGFSITKKNGTIEKKRTEIDLPSDEEMYETEYLMEELLEDDPIEIAQLDEVIETIKEETLDDLINNIKNELRNKTLLDDLDNKGETVDAVSTTSDQLKNNLENGLTETTLVDNSSKKIEEIDQLIKNIEDELSESAVDQTIEKIEDTSTETTALNQTTEEINVLAEKKRKILKNTNNSKIKTVTALPTETEPGTLRTISVQPTDKIVKHTTVKRSVKFLPNITIPKALQTSKPNSVQPRNSKVTYLLARRTSIELNKKKLKMLLGAPSNHSENKITELPLETISVHPTNITTEESKEIISDLDDSTKIKQKRKTMIQYPAHRTSFQSTNTTKDNSSTEQITRTSPVEPINTTENNLPMETTILDQSTETHNNTATISKVLVQPTNKIVVYGNQPVKKPKVTQITAKLAHPNNAAKPVQNIVNLNRSVTVQEPESPTYSVGPMQNSVSNTSYIEPIEPPNYITEKKVCTNNPAVWKRLSTLSEQLNRNEKRFAKLKTKYKFLLKKFNNLKNTSQKNMSQAVGFDHICNNMSPAAKIFFKMQMQGGKKERGRRFTTEGKMWSYSFYKQFPDAYKSLRNSFILPNIRSLRSLKRQMSATEDQIIQDIDIEHRENMAECRN